MLGFTFSVNYWLESAQIKFWGLLRSLDYLLLHILLVVKFNGLTKFKGDVEHFAREEMEMHGSIQTNINNVIAQSSIRILAATQHPFSLLPDKKIVYLGKQITQPKGYIFQAFLQLMISTFLSAGQRDAGGSVV